jgi:[ribosomal protein S5]-alanine N-acetyltransferase
VAGARVLIRPPERADRAEYLAGMRASERFHRPWLSGTTEEAAFDRLLGKARDPRYSPRLVCLRDTGAIAGFFNISEIVRGQFQSAFLGYGAMAAYARHGYMREGLELVLEHAFTGLRLHRLEANIQPANEASISLVRGGGFVYEGMSERYLKVGGRWRDHEHWAIRSELWRDRRRR